jgi:hypothetical protein
MNIIPIEKCVSARYVDLMFSNVYFDKFNCRAFKKASERKWLLISILVLLYSISIPYCYITSGEPRRLAMIQAQKIADEKWERESILGFRLDSDSNSSTFNSTIFQDSNEPNPIIISGVTSEDKLFTEDGDLTDEGDAVKKESSKSFFSGWLGPTKEQKKAQQEFEKWQKSFREKLPEGTVIIFFTKVYDIDVNFMFRIRWNFIAIKISTISMGLRSITYDIIWACIISSIMPLASRV